MLAPAERVAFVLHDMFGVPFEEIAIMVGRSPAATRQLASRARRRVHGTDTVPRTDVGRGREVVEAFLAAARGGDVAALIALLDPDVVLRVDPVAGAAGAAREVRGAAAVAGRASTFAARHAFARTALVNGTVGFVVAPLGRPQVAFAFTIADGSIAGIDVVTDPRRLRELDVAVID